ncbi:MAG: asparagine synthetase A [Candidatus Hodarchaeales archaeon]|jgi:asparaginyl-tRNA synthetase
MQLDLIHELKRTKKLSDAELTAVLKVQTVAIKAIHDFLYDRGLIQLMPVILSPITDPLNHPVYEATIKYMNQDLKLTKSMILHKQIAIATLEVEGLYIMSPNIRLEKDVIDSPRHLLEFSQLDIELKHATAEEFMSLTEDLIIFIFSKVLESCTKELVTLGIRLQIPSKPFRIYWSWDQKEKYGAEYRSKISKIETDPFWITDFEREFYDREDESRAGHYINYDLFYPEGFGEGLSGGERDYEYDILVRKLKERDQELSQFGAYLDLAKEGKLVPSAGGGLGIERLVRFLTKQKHIRDITLFPKVPGEKVIL